MNRTWGKPILLTAVLLAMAAIPARGDHVSLSVQLTPGPYALNQEVRANIYATAVPAGEVYKVSYVQAVFIWDPAILKITGVIMNDGDNTGGDRDFDHFGWYGALNENSGSPPLDGDGTFIAYSFSNVEVYSTGELVGTIVFKAQASAPCTSVVLLRQLGQATSDVWGETLPGFVESVGPQPDMVPAVDIQATPGTAVCSGTAVVLDAGADYAAYRWSTGATTRTISVSQSGTYSVTVTDTAGCRLPGRIVIDIASPHPVITATPPALICTGALVTLDAGSGYASYLWSNGATTQTTIVSGPGTYTVTVTDAKGCNGSDGIVIPDALAIEATPSAVICGSSPVTLDAGAGFKSYLWSTGDLTQTIVVTTAGTYTVSVTDANGCQSSDDIVVTTGQSPTVQISATPGSTICQGRSVTLTAGGSQGTYLWSTGATTQSIIVNTAGTYTVTLTNAAGCQASVSTVITVNPAPVVAITANPPSRQVCQGESVILTATGTSGTYLWSTGATTQSISVNTSGTYSVTLTDAKGCQASTTADVTVNPLPIVSVTANPPSAKVCQGGSVTLTAGGTTGTYTWSTGATTQSIVVSASGTYSVTVTDAKGCHASASIQVTVNAPPTVSITANPSATVCEGTTVSLDAGAGFASYAWSNGATTQTTTVTVAGTYSVTVTDANGCQGTANILVKVNQHPTVQIAAAPSATVCQGTVVTLDAGSGFTSYHWSTSATTRTIDVTAGGIYSVTVTNAEGCTGSAEVTVTYKASPTVSITAPQTSFCPGGFVTLTAAGDPGTYAWTKVGSSGTLGTASTYDASVAGTYRLTVTNAQSCTGFAEVTITQKTPPTVSITAPQTSFCPGGFVTLTAAGDPGTYAWTKVGSSGTLGTASTYDASAAGTYRLTVTNAEGCTGFAEVTITQKTPPTVSITAPQTSFCPGGFVTLTAAGDTGTYAWTKVGSSGTLGTASTYDASAAGTYRLTVTNAEGCTGFAEVIITQKTAPSVSISPSATSFCPGGSVTLTAGGDTGTYAWTKVGSSDTLSTTNTLNVTAAGTYRLTVTNAGGCTGFAEVTITQKTAPSVSITAPETSFCPGGSVTLTAAGDTGTYAWTKVGSSGTLSTTNKLVVDTAGTYVLTVTNAQSCTGSAQVIITQKTAPTVSITAPQTSFCTGGSVTLTAAGDTGTYAWTRDGTPGTLGTSKTYDASIAGTYHLTVTNAQSCTGTAQVTITQYTSPTVSITAPLTYFCIGGSVTLTAGGDGGTYAWTKVGTSGTIGALATLEVTTPGTYRLTVTNPQGCTGSAEITITEKSAPNVTIGSPETSICPGASLTLTAGGDSGTYAWTKVGASGTLGTASTLDVTEAATYRLTVTNGQGCSGTAEITITQNTAPTVSINPSATSFCAGGSVTLTADGDAGSYAWTKVGASGVLGTTTTLNVTSAGTYKLTVTNSQGCAGSAEVTISQKATPVVSIDAPQTAICPGGSVTLTAGGDPGTYAWTKDGSPDTIGTSATLKVTAAGTYHLTVTNDQSCSGTAQVTITQKPVPTVTIGANPGTSVCPGTTVTLTAGGDAGTYDWSKQGSAGSIGTTQSIDVTEAGTYQLTVTSDQGCTGTATITITHKSAPTVSIGADPGSAFCPGTTVTLTANGAVGTFVWTKTGSPGTIGTTQSIQVTQAGTYKVVVTSAEGCQSNAEITLTEKAAPAVTISADPGPAFCPGGSVTLKANGATGTFAWSKVGSSGTIGTTDTLSVSEAGTYRVTVTNEQGCSGSAEIAVTQKVAPNVTINATPGTSFCPGASVTLTAGGDAGTYAWTKVGSTGTIGTTQSINVTEAATYRVTVTSGQGCQGFAEITITASSKPTATASNSGPVKAGATIQLTGGPNGMSSYHWTGPGGFTSTAQNPTTVQATQGSYEYCLTVTNGSGCESTPACTTVVVQKACIKGDMDYSGFVSIIGDVPPFVQCVYFGNCPSQPDLVCPGDCNGDGFLSIIGDVPCFVQCVYFGSCGGQPVAIPTAQDEGNLLVGGQIYTDLGNPMLSGMAGVLITLTGNGQTYTATTESAPLAGLWQVSVPPGSYTVTPSLSGKEFVHVTAGQATSDAAITIQVDAAHLPENQSIQFLTKAATPPCSNPVTIGGQVYADLGNPMTSGVTGVHIVVEGTCGRFETDTLATPVPGLWSIANVPSGSYTVTPTLSGKEFGRVTGGQDSGQATAAITVDAAHLAENQSIQFLAKAVVPPCSNPLTIGGQVYSDLKNPMSSGLTGVHIIAEGECGRFETDTVTTPVPGLWSIAGVPSNSYTVTVTMGGHCFEHVQAGKADGQHSLAIQVNQANQATNQSIQFLSHVLSPMDFDQDCDVDLTDSNAFMACVSGPAIPLSGSACTKADFDGDNDVDGVDFGLFQRCFGGADKPSPANCGG